MFPFLHILLPDGISNSSGSTPQRLDHAVYAATTVQILVVAIVFWFIYAFWRMGRVTRNVGVESDQYSLIDSRPGEASEFTKPLVSPPALIRSTDHIDSFETSAETHQTSTAQQLNLDLSRIIPSPRADDFLLPSLISLSHHTTTPCTHTGIGSQFDNINIRQPQNTPALEIDKELDLSIIEPLNADALSSLMRKQSEDVWDFMDI